MEGRPRAPLAVTIQRRLERFYALDDGPPVDAFARQCDEGEREVVMVREQHDAVELEVALPAEALTQERAEGLSLDTLCQIVEGVSHFVYLAERIRTETPTTQLELELQAEVDKFVVMAEHSIARGDVRARTLIHERLYERVRYLHAASSELGERYRTANRLAARFCARLSHHIGDARRALRAFYRVGQQDKIRLAQAA